MVQGARFALIKGRKTVKKEREIVFYAFCAPSSAPAA
jgi:hypothetical protein